jgi:hypothetical protein
VAQADSLLQDVRALRSKAYSLLLAAERAGDLRTALAGVREARECLALLAKIEGAIDERPQVHLHVSAEWLAVRAALLEALAPFPEARATVAARLRVLSAAEAA